MARRVTPKKQARLERLSQRRKAQRIQAKAERTALEMLLGAEWKTDLQCFVKQVHEEPNESDGWVWPVPTFEFFTREGRQLEGREKDRKLKMARAHMPPAARSVFTPGPINQRINNSFNKSITATEIAMKMEEASKRMAGQMAQQMDDQFMDALMYGRSFGEMKAPKEPPKLDTIKFRTIHDSMKIMRPGLNVTKVPTV